MLGSQKRYFYTAEYQQLRFLLKIIWTTVIVRHSPRSNGCLTLSYRRYVDAFCVRVILRTAVNLKEEGNISGVRSKPLLMNDLRNMVVPSINDAIWLLEKEIAFPYPGLARRAVYRRCDGIASWFPREWNYDGIMKFSLLTLLSLFLLVHSLSAVDADGDGLGSVFN